MEFGHLEGVPPRKIEPTFKRVGDLIDYLEILGRERLLILDDDGNTYDVPSSMICLWDENDPQSPVAIYVPR